MAHSVPSNIERASDLQNKPVQDLRRTPNLKADANFRDLQAQLEGTENRITVARNRYITSVQAFNVTVRSFPSNLTAIAMGYKPKPNFTVENEKGISSAPKVDFGSTPASQAGTTSGAAK